jgi:hypothetical protein
MGQRFEHVGAFEMSTPPAEERLKELNHETQISLKNHGSPACGSENLRRLGYTSLVGAGLLREPHTGLAQSE